MGLAKHLFMCKESKLEVPVKDKAATDVGIAVFCHSFLIYCLGLSWLLIIPTSVLIQLLFLHLISCPF